MKLLTVVAWLDKYFDLTSRPSEITVAGWLRDGKIPGRKIGRTWYIDEHAWLAADDDLVSRVLGAG